jgi:hypothetical protein
MEDQEYIRDKIKGILLLGKPENVRKNILGMLGLYPMDFGGSETRVTWDEMVIQVHAKPFEGTCTCALGKDPKVHRVGEDFHSSWCELARFDHVARNPCLISMEPEGDAQHMVYTFQWPRDLTTSKPVIRAIFPELMNELLWPNFVKGWNGIIALMPPMLPSYWDGMAPKCPLLEGLNMEPNEPTDETTPDPYLDDLDLGTTPEPEPIPEPKPEPVEPEPKPVEPEPIPVPLPLEEAPKKRGPGRPKGSRNKKKETDEAEPEPEPQPEGSPEPAPEPTEVKQEEPEPGRERLGTITFFRNGDGIVTRGTLPEVDIEGGIGALIACQLHKIARSFEDKLFND